MRGHGILFSSTVVFLSLKIEFVLANLLRVQTLSTAFYLGLIVCKSTRSTKGKGWITNLSATVPICECSKFPKSWTFETPILQFAVSPPNVHNFKFKWSNAFRQTEYKLNKRAVIISLIQHFELLWKVSLKILIYGTFLKTFAHLFLTKLLY